MVLALAGIHPGEIDGKDAGFILMRELLLGNALPGVLRHVTFVLVPIFNVDGHEHPAPAAPPQPERSAGAGLAGHRPRT